jgi:hypothetical protein
MLLGGIFVVGKEQSIMFVSKLDGSGRKQALLPMGQPN